MRSICLALGLLLATAHVLHAQETERGIQDNGDLRKVIGELAAAIQNRDFPSAMDLMTNDAKDNFVFNCCLVSMDASAEQSRLGRRLRAVNKKLGLKPEFLNDMMNEDIQSEAQYRRILASLQKQILSVLGTREKQAAAVKLIRQAGDSADGDFATFLGWSFGGKILEIEGNEDTATIHVLMDQEHDFLIFEKTAKGWLFSGQDEEKYMEANYDNIPLIENFELAGVTTKGETVDLKKYRGKIVLVDFWGTWCGPCVAELPTLEKIYAALNQHGFEIIGVAQDEAATLKKFAGKHPLPWANIVDGDSKISSRYQVQAFPTVLLIDKAGKHYESNFFGAELLDHLIEKLELDPDDFRELAGELREVHGGMDHDEDGTLDNGRPPVGFEYADEDGDQKVAADEMRQYLEDRIDVELPYEKIFNKLDADGDGIVSSMEFESRHEVIESFMGQGFFGAATMPEPVDPGQDFIPISQQDAPIDDRKIFGALFHRYQELLRNEAEWPQVELEDVPSVMPKAVQLNVDESSEGTSVSRLMQATGILAGGGDQFFSAGVVLVSKDGLAVTNYHVAEAMKDSKLAVLTSDGKMHRVIEFVAGNRSRDVALVKLEGQDFPHVTVAAKSPRTGDDLVMIHHSENRFYTYDRGYLMRHPVIGEHPWMEVSMDYAPGGSGCGIFNSNHELVGLVSTIQFGDGPSIAEPFMEWDEEHAPEQPDENSEFQEEAIIMVKQAVSQQAIRSLLTPIQASTGR